MATPGSHTPLIIPPFLTPPVGALLRNVCFPICFLPQMAPRAVLPSPHSPSAHATHPSFWDAGRPQKIFNIQCRSRTATESPHVAPRAAWTDPLQLKMCHLGGLRRPFSSKNGDSGVLLRTHYLLCFHSKNRILRRLRTMWRPALEHCPRLAP